MKQSKTSLFLTNLPGEIVLKVLPFNKEAEVHSRLCKNIRDSKAFLGANRHPELGQRVKIVREVTNEEYYKELMSWDYLRSLNRY